MSKPPVPQNPEDNRSANTGPVAGSTADLAMKTIALRDDELEFVEEAAGIRPAHAADKTVFFDPTIVPPAPVAPVAQSAPAHFEPAQRNDRPALRFDTTMDIGAFARHLSASPVPFQEPPATPAVAPEQPVPPPAAKKAPSFTGTMALSADEQRRFLESLSVPFSSPNEPAAAAPPPISTPPPEPLPAPPQPAVAAPFFVERPAMLNVPAAEPVTAAEPPPAMVLPVQSIAAVSADPPQQKTPLDLAGCATIAAEFDARRATRAQVLAKHEIDEADWDKAEQRWKEAIARDMNRNKRTLRDAYDDAYVAARDKLQGAISVNRYARLSVALESGTLAEELESANLNRGVFMRIQRVWKRKMKADSKLAESVNRAKTALRRSNS